MSSLLRSCTILIALTLFSAPALGLTADQIVLIVNRAEPAGVDLARFYAQARGIPVDRILALDLPTTEEMPFDRYERAVAPVVRKFLRDQKLDQSVRCLVTFYGVPLRISNRENGPLEAAELRDLRATMDRLTARLSEIASDTERQAMEADPAFKPANQDKTLDALSRRTSLAGQAMEQALVRSNDLQLRLKLAESIKQITTRIAQPLDGPAPTAPPATLPAADLLERPYDAASRAALRELAKFGGVFNHARLMQHQMEYLLTDATGSAVDNELALIFWPPHTRVRWQENPLNAKYFGLRGPPTLMVMRLDAPVAQTVRDMIANTLATERDGLKGTFAIDARGIAPKKENGEEDAYGVFDQRIRDLATFMKQKTSIPIKLDDRPDVFPATPLNEDIALYTGWYSLANYIPAFKFNRGAVGYHIASFELMHLRGPLTGHWVRNLIDNGCVATLGPVAEPYLHSFPPPDEFFPLLLTGRLTLAEVYWATTPLTSWMQTAIGDPLYKPFAKNPALPLDQLPPQLRRVAEAGAIPVSP